MKETILTDRLILREFEFEDVEDFYEYANNPFVGPNAGWTPHRSICESEAILNMFMKNDEVWAIVYKKNNKVIGSIGLHDDLLRSTVKNLKTKCLGYAISYNYWGLGIATEAVKAIQKYAFEKMQLDILSVDHYPDNKRSMRVIEKCGFKFEGTLRKARPSYENKPMDIACYSLFKEEWEKLKGIE